MGTLAGVEQTCMTPTEWAKQSDDAKSMWEDVQGKKGLTNDRFNNCVGQTCDATAQSGINAALDRNSPHL
jgi:hypothetical protein